MNNTHRLSKSVQAAAADWFARELRGPLSAADSAALGQWLNASAEHQLAYEQCRHLWLMSSALGELPELAEELRSVRRLAQKRPASIWRHLGQIAAVALVGLSLWFGLVHLGPDTYETAVGEQHLVRLEDGSSILLNTNSRVTVDYQDEARLIDLEQGEAFFRVAHNPRRPFIVNAQDSQVQAIGTAFNVDLSTDNIHVAVTEGVVKVSTRGKGALQAIAKVQHGEGLSYLPTASQADPVSVDLKKVTAWQARKLLFDNERLSDAIAEHNRYTEQPILLAGDLGDQRISGVFNIGDTESLIFALRKTFDVHVLVEPDSIRVLPATSVKSL